MLTDIAALVVPKVMFRGKSEPVQLMTPCLFPNMEGEALVARIVSTDYYPIELDLQNAGSVRTFFVKRTTKSLVSRGGLGMQRPLLVQSGYCNKEDLAYLVKYRCGNRYLQAFANYLCVWMSSSSCGSSVEKFCKSVLLDYTCTDLTLPMYLRLRTAFTSIKAQSSSSAILAWDFRLIRSYYESSTRSNADESQSLLNIEKVAYLIESVERLAVGFDHENDCNSSWRSVLSGLI